MALLVDGCSNKQVARRLCISENGAKRHVASVLGTDPDHPRWTLKGIKAYRARHEIVPWQGFANLETHMDPNDPELYRPFYLGMYDAEGKLTIS